MKVAKKEVVEFGDFKQFVGLESFSILAVNPTKKELNALYGKEDSPDDTEIEYVDEKEECDRIRINVYVRGQQTNRICRIGFMLVDKQRINKEGDKAQFINQTCVSTWCDEESNLPTWFTEFLDKDKSTSLGKKSFRKAIEGEADFYEFVRNVTRGINYYSTDTELHFNFAKLLKGDFSQLNQILVEGEYSYPFVALNYVRFDADSGKYYNEIFSKSILPPIYLDKVKMLQQDYYKEIVEELKDDERFKDYAVLTSFDVCGYVNEPDVKFKKEFENKTWSKFISEVSGQYGARGFYKICPVFEYKKDMNPISSDSPLTSDSDY